MMQFFMEMGSDNLFRYNMKVSVCETNSIESKQMLKMCLLTKWQVPKHSFKRKSKASATISFPLKISPFGQCLIFLVLVAISEAVFYGDRDAPPLGKTENPGNEPGTQGFRYPKASALSRNTRTESA